MMVAAPLLHVAFETQNQTMRNDTRLDTALELSTLADERVTVGMLVQCTGLSPSRFSHLFARRTGMLPKEHLRVMKRFNRERKMALEILTSALRPQNLPE